MAIVPGYLVASGSDYTIDLAGPAIAWFVADPVIAGGITISTVYDNAHYRIWIDTISGNITLGSSTELQIVPHSWNFRTDLVLRGQGIFLPVLTGLPEFQLVLTGRLEIEVTE